MAPLLALGSAKLFPDLSVEQKFTFLGHKLRAPTHTSDSTVSILNISINIYETLAKWQLSWVAPAVCRHCPKLKHTHKLACQDRIVKTHGSPPLLNTTESRTLGQGSWVIQRPSEGAAKPTEIVSLREFLGWCLAARLLSHHVESWSPCPAFGVGMGSLVLSWTNLTQACHLLGNQSIGPEWASQWVWFSAGQYSTIRSMAFVLALSLPYQLPTAVPYPWPIKSTSLPSLVTVTQLTLLYSHQITHSSRRLSRNCFYPLLWKLLFHPSPFCPLHTEWRLIIPRSLAVKALDRQGSPRAMLFKLIESPTKLCPLKMRNLVLLSNDHSSFTHLQTLPSPFIPKEHKQKEIIFHGLNLATQDLISTKGNYSEVGWTLVESGHFLGALESWATTNFRHSRTSHR